MSPVLSGVVEHVLGLKAHSTTLATVYSTVLRHYNQTMSSWAYKLGIMLHHSGLSEKVIHSMIFNTM